MIFKDNSRQFGTSIIVNSKGILVVDVAIRHLS